MYSARAFWNRLVADLTDSSRDCNSDFSCVNIISIYRTRALTALGRAKWSWHIGYSSPSLAGTIAAAKAGLLMFAQESRRC